MLEWKRPALGAAITLAVALLFAPLSPARAQTSTLHIYGTGTPSTSASVTITESGSSQAFLCPDAINLYNGGSISYWGSAAICNAPLAERIIAFRARLVKGGAQLEWTTANEQCMAGFHVRRKEVHGRAANRVTSAMISPRGNALTGATYSWLDGSIKPSGDYYYWLEVIKDDGRSELVGPVRLIVDSRKRNGVGPDRVQLPGPGSGDDNGLDAGDAGGGCTLGPGPPGGAVLALLLLLLALVRGRRRR